MKTLSELKLEAASRAPILPPAGYIHDPDGKISEAIRSRKNTVAVPLYIAPIIFTPVAPPPPIPEPLEEQEEPIVIVEEPVEVVDKSEEDDTPVCPACESGDCSSHGASVEDTVIVESPEPLPDLAEGEPAREQGDQSLDESNSVPEGVTDNIPEQVLGDGTGTAPDAVTPASD